MRLGTCLTSTFKITKGASRKQNAAVVRVFTETLARKLGKKPEPIPIGIEKAVLEAWGFGGLLSDALRKGK
jgi:phenylpyruvate tautomerase PptA (4-oxalocrotonate tautomerase family)